MSKGTKDDPIYRGSRDQTPTKYQCGDCARWFVEPEYDLLVRDSGCTTDTGIPICADCAHVRVEAQWDAHGGRARRRWEALLRR